MILVDGMGEEAGDLINIVIYLFSLHVLYYYLRTHTERLAVMKVSMHVRTYVRLSM